MSQERLNQEAEADDEFEFGDDRSCSRYSSLQDLNSTQKNNNNAAHKKAVNGAINDVSTMAKLLVSIEEREKVRVKSTETQSEDSDGGSALHGSKSSSSKKKRKRSGKKKKQQHHQRRSRCVSESSIPLVSWHSTVLRLFVLFVFGSAVFGIF